MRLPRVRFTVRRLTMAVELPLALTLTADTWGQGPPPLCPPTPGKGLPGGHLPTRLRRFVGGFLGPSYWVDLEGDALTYRARRFDPEANRFKETIKRGIKPSADQWGRFWRALDEARLWQWRAHYPAPPNLADGTQWSVDIDVRGRVVKSSGDKNFPGRPSGVTSELFEKYLAAVRALLGGEEFR
jgi:hypothetical protein